MSHTTPLEADIVFGHGHTDAKRLRATQDKVVGHVETKWLATGSIWDKVFVTWRAVAPLVSNDSTSRLRQQSAGIHPLELGIKTPDLRFFRRLAVPRRRITAMRSPL